MDTRITPSNMVPTTSTTHHKDSVSRTSADEETVKYYLDGFESRTGSRDAVLVVLGPRFELGTLPSSGECSTN
jgi:hypothetical protein